MPRQYFRRESRGRIPLMYSCLASSLVLGLLFKWHLPPQKLSWFYCTGDNKDCFLHSALLQVCIIDQTVCSAFPLCYFGPACFWRIFSNALGCRIFLSVESSDYYAWAERERKEFNVSTAAFQKKSSSAAQCERWDAANSGASYGLCICLVFDEWKCCLYVKMIEFEMVLF